MPKLALCYAAALTLLAALVIACGGPPAPNAAGDAPGVAPAALTEPAPAATSAAPPPTATDAPASDAGASSANANAADSAASDPTAPPTPTPTPPAPAQETATMLSDPPNPHTLDAFPPTAAYGDYAVGTATTFAVDNRQRFDPWNTAYASARYRELLRRIEAAGQTRTVVFQLWYPAVPDTDAGRLDGPRSPYPAVDGQRAARGDFFLGYETAAVAAAGGLLNPLPIDDAAGGSVSLGTAPSVLPAADLADLARRAMAQPLNAWRNATPAPSTGNGGDNGNGKFPVIVLAHGLGGHHSMWGNYAEFLVSHGYIVAAPTFISDGSLPMVFHDPASPFANAVTPAEVQDAYRILSGEGKVIPQFYRFMFGPGGFDRSRAQAVPGGVERVTTMMRNLFRQRVSDVGLVLHTVRLLGADAADCRTALTAMGAVTAAADLCGRLAGRVDAGRAGLSGHSLGGMTAQLGANHLPGVDAALSISNVPPFTWTPEEMYGAGETADGLPVGSRQPTLIMIGDEDDFVQSIFVTLFQATLAAAGGDPTLVFPLAAERALPDRLENPQPVDLANYQRATGDRILAIVRDTDHDILVADYARNNPRRVDQQGDISAARSPVRRRKVTGDAALELSPPSGESYYQLDWVETGDGVPVYLPHLIRDWYARAWFDWYLKDDEEARRRLQSDDPFGELTYTLREVR